MFKTLVPDSLFYYFYTYSEFNMGSAIEDMQVGCLWQGDYLLSVSLSGNINYLDVNNPSQPIRIVKGSCQLHWILLI